jgi:hypothetical protein
MNEYQDDVGGTHARTMAERHIESIREKGGLFVEAGPGDADADDRDRRDKIPRGESLIDK